MSQPASGAQRNREVFVTKAQRHFGLGRRASPQPSTIPALAVLWVLWSAASPHPACSHLPLELGYAPAAHFPAGTLVTFKTLDTVSLNARVFMPAGWTKGDRRPAIVMVFGGGWCWCCSGQLEPYWQHFTAQGFVCVLPDYRLVACGSAKAGCIEEKCIPDVKSAVRWVRTKADSLGIDSHRIIGMGWSAGGHLAAAAAVFAGMENPGEDLAVSSRPDLLALFYPVLTFDPSTRGTIFKDMMRDTTAIAPALHLSVSTPPTLIMVGSRDDYFGGDTVFMRNAKALRLDAVMKVAPGAGHDFANSGSGLDSCKAWCTEFFKARAFWPR